MKKLLAMLLALAMVFALAACGNNDDVEEEPEEEEVVEVEPEEPEEEPEEVEQTAAPAEASGELGDSLYSFNAQLDGVVYSFPCSMDELVADGWDSEDFGEVELSSNQYGGIYFTKGDAEFRGYVVNTGGNTLDARDCEFGGFDISSSDFDRKAEISVVMPGGITFGSTEDELIDAHGEPSDLYDGDYSKVYRYSTGNYGEVKFTFREDGVVEDIYIQNLIPKADNSGLDVGDLDLPAEMDRYKAPTSLGSDWTDFTINYAGDYYTLPAPVAEFLANGWELVDDASDTVGSQSSVSTKLRKDNQELRTRLQNWSDSEQPLTGCWVTQVEYNRNGPTLSLEVSGGISEKSSEAEVIAAYGAYDKDEDPSSMFSYGYYGTYSQNLQFSYDIETGEITRIELQYNERDMPW